MSDEASGTTDRRSDAVSVRRLRPGVWWLSPSWTSLLVVGPSLLLAWLTGNEAFREHWGAPKYLTSSQALWFAACLGAFVLFTRVAARTKYSPAALPMRISVHEAHLVRKAGLVLFWLTVFGYLVWIGFAIHGEADLTLVSAVLEGEAGAVSRLKEHIRPVAGLTTFSQFAAPAIVCLMVDRRIAGRRNTVLICLLLVLPATRALLYAERLALVEVLVPMLLVLAAWPASGTGRRRRWPWALVPLAAPFGMAVIFGSYEYLRSWAWVSQGGRQDLLPYMLNRLGAYYATPYNNSALALEHIAPRLKLPYYTADWFWSLPMTDALLDREEYLGINPDALWADTLARYTNPEFNNLGFAGPLADYGLVGALAWWAMAGLLIGMCFQAMRAGRLAGLLLYAVVFVGLLEMPRYQYWTAGRAMPALLAAFILAVLLSRARKGASSSAITQETTRMARGWSVRREHMGIRHLYNNVVQQFWCILAGLLVGGLGAAWVTMLMTPTYQSTTSIYVYVPRPVAGLGDAYQGALYTQQQVKAYADLVRTEAIARPVAKELGARSTRLKKQVNAHVPMDSVVLSISAVDQSPKRAARIANAFATELTSYVNNLEKASRQVQLRVVDTAQPSNTPHSPSLLFNLSVGMIAGAFAGLGLGTAVTRLDSRIKSVKQLATLVPCPILASIPTNDAPEHGKINNFSSYAESLRKLRANLSFLGADRPNGTFLVTSPTVGEGKSTIAIHLAKTLVDSGARCLLIDADLRRPTVATRLKAVGEVGLSSVLAGMTDLDTVLQDHEGLTVLTSGPNPPNPTELLGGESMTRLLESLSDRFDHVIIDSAPLLPVADTQMLAPHVDGVILIARRGKTRAEELTEAVAALKAANARLVGVVQNAATDSVQAYGYSAAGGTQVPSTSVTPAKSEEDTAEPVLTSADR